MNRALNLKRLHFGENSEIFIVVKSMLMRWDGFDLGRISGFYPTFLLNMRMLR